MKETEYDIDDDPPVNETKEEGGEESGAPKKSSSGDGSGNYLDIKAHSGEEEEDSIEGDTKIRFF